jgi:2',3'-cyclic-nucleotide 2'-phosphodiesterase (5'-nucleotidase family)
MDVLLIDTGDALVGGGLLGDKTQGEAVVAGMGQMGYDAMALGPKELSLGPAILAQRIEQTDLAMLSANVILRKSQALFADPYTVLTFGDHRLGILGLTRSESDIPPDFEVLDPQQMLERYLPELMEQADVVIVLTNIGYRPARALLQSVEGVDLLVAALPSQLPAQAVREPRSGMLAVVADQAVPRHSGRRVGRLSVTVNSDGSLSNERWVSIPMDDTYTDDLAMAILLDKYAQP